MQGDRYEFIIVGNGKNSQTLALLQTQINHGAGKALLDFFLP